MNRGQFPKPCCRPHPGKGLARLSGRTIICRNTHHIMYPTRNRSESRTKVSLGVRGHTPAPQRAHAPPTLKQHHTDNHQRPLTSHSDTSKQGPAHGGRIGCFAYAACASGAAAAAVRGSTPGPAWSRSSRHREAAASDDAICGRRIERGRTSGAPMPMLVAQIDGVPIVSRRTQGALMIVIGPELVLGATSDEGHPEA
jgi:hypothetical protein